MKSCLKSVTAVLAVLQCVACYGYKNVRAPQAGMEVRARLKGEAAAKRSEGRDDPIIRYDGVVVASSPEAVSLNVLVARSSSSFQDVEIRDTVRIEISEIQSLQQRTLSVPKTALFVVVAGAAAFGAIRGIQEVVGGTEDMPPPGTQNFTSPLFSVRTLRIILGTVHR